MLNTHIFNFDHYYGFTIYTDFNIIMYAIGKIYDNEISLNLRSMYLILWLTLYSFL